MFLRDVVTFSFLVFDVTRIDGLIGVPTATAEDMAVLAVPLSRERLVVNN